MTIPRTFEGDTRHTSGGYDVSYSLWTVRTEDPSGNARGAYVLASAKDEAIEAAYDAIGKDLGPPFDKLVSAQRISGVPHWAAEAIYAHGYCTWED